MREHGEGETESAELWLVVARGREVLELGIGAREVRQRQERRAAPELFRREREDREPASGGGGEAGAEATGRLGGATAQDDDVGGTDLEDEAFQRPGGAAAGQFSEAADLPGVERGVADGEGRRVEEEHPRVATGWARFKHRGGVRRGAERAP